MFNNLLTQIKILNKKLKKDLHLNFFLETFKLFEFLIFTGR